MNLPDLPALSIRHPWAWLILHAGKDIENRSRRTNYRGEFLIHASGTCTRRDWIEAARYYESVMLMGECSAEAGAIPHRLDLECGGIVGIAEIVGCVSESDSPWFFGPRGYVLPNVRPLPFTPCKGRLGFFYPTGNRSLTNR